MPSANIKTTRQVAARSRSFIASLTCWYFCPAIIASATECSDSCVLNSAGVFLKTSRA